MKIEIAMFGACPPFEGLILVDGELMKVFLHPPKDLGKGWVASLLTGAFVELDQEGVWYDAIKKAVEEQRRPCQKLTKDEDELETMLEGLLNEDKETVRRLMKGE